MNPEHTLEEAQERAALYSLGAMAPAEAREFAEHLPGCDVCAREVAGFTDVIDELAAAAEPLAPPDSLRAKVLERMAAPVLDQDGVRFVRAGQLGWEETSLPQVERKSLFLDPQRGYRTQLIRMGPGALYPSHRHADVEEIYLIEGDLTVCGVSMRAGDYCRAEIDSVHEGISTVGGCVFFALYSAHNEFFR